MSKCETDQGEDIHYFENDGKISHERNILERLKSEVMNSFYDYVVIEVGSNEVSNYKGKEQKPADRDEYITGRLEELCSCIKEIQEIR